MGGQKPCRSRLQRDGEEEDGGISKMDVGGGLREMGKMKETGGRWENGG